MVEGGVDNPTYFNTVQVSNLAGGGVCGTPSATDIRNRNGNSNDNGSPSGSATCTPAGTPGVLYDQINNPAPTPGGVTSQDFEAANDAFDSFAADDFVVPAGQTWNVTQVVVSGEYSGAAACGRLQCVLLFRHGDAAGSIGCEPSGIRVRKCGGYVYDHFGIACQPAGRHVLGIGTGKAGFHTCRAVVLGQQGCDIELWSSVAESWRRLCGGMYDVGTKDDVSADNEWP